MKNQALMSSRISIGTSQVCIYCGKELGVNFSNLDKCDIFYSDDGNCDCENALKELEMKKELLEKTIEIEKFINENGYPKEVVDKMKDYVEQYPASVDLKAEIKAV